MKNRIVNLLSLLLFILPGCNDSDFLSETPKTFYTPDNAFSTSEQVNQVLVGCYMQIRSMYTVIEENATSWAFRCGVGTDMYDVATIRRSATFSDYGIINPEHEVFRTNYGHWYELIAKANLAIHAAELPQITWASPQDKAYTLAQARFFRAWCYRNLGELYGGVPIVTETVTTARYDYARAERVATYQFAIDELEAVVNDLPETTATAGRIVRGAAQHTLCQLYLDKGIALEGSGNSSEARAAYAKSVDYGNQLIDGSTYSLMTERFGSRRTENPDYYYASTEAEQRPGRLYSDAGIVIEGNVIWDMFQEGNQNYQNGNREAIWVAQINYAAYRAEDGQSKLQYSRVFGPVFRDPMGSICGGALEDVGGRGVVEASPTMYTRDVIYEGKWSDDMRNSEAVFRRTFLGSNMDSEWFGKPIPWSVLYRDGMSEDAVNAAKTQVFPISCKIATDKYRGIADGENRSNLFRNEYLIRLAETVLLRAEAKMRSGDNAGAAADINLLRARAKCSYMATAADVSISLILDERARELVYEETRWNTLLRMGGTVAVERIKQYAYWDDPRTTLKKNFNLWPIPQSVIDINKDVVLEQNPGWGK